MQIHMKLLNAYQVYIMSSVCLESSPFPQSYFMQYVGLCVLTWHFFSVDVDVRIFYVISFWNKKYESLLIF